MINKTSSKLNIPLRGMLLFLILIIIEFFALVLVALIPNSYIQDNLEQSADFLCKKSVFFYASEVDKASKIDRYADSILLNIAYNYQSEKPFQSVMSSSYYFTFDKNENINLQTAVMENPAPTLEYSRYWHGSIAIIRPLLTLLNIEQIYIFNAVLLVLLLVMLTILIAKHIGKGGAFSFIFGIVMISIWYVPMSLEYTWTIFIMLIASIVTIKRLISDKEDFNILFLIVGNVTAYFDFLTTETLTFLVPTCLILTYNYKNNKLGSFVTELKTIIKYGITWLAGYLFTWVAKWSLASVILQKNVFADALSQAKFRTSGQTEDLSGLSQRFAAEVRNISNLFPFSNLNSHSLLFAMTFFAVIFSVIFLIRKERNTYNYLLALIAIIPYIRYFVLGNHSYMHHFFTFRAQLATILCLGLILIYGSDKAMLSKEWKKLWKKL